MYHLLPAPYRDRLRRNEPLARHTSARVGGPAEALCEIESASELAELAAACWLHNIPFTILGGATNVLISDSGLPGLVILNHARQHRFNPDGTLWAESGANFGGLARQACAHGLSGLEWAIGIPGTLGGAIFGNAGAHGSDISKNLLLAEILQQTTGQIETWPVERFHYAYRSSILKQPPVIASAAQQSSPAQPAPVIASAAKQSLPTDYPLQATSDNPLLTAYCPLPTVTTVILTATLRLTPSDPATTQALAESYTAQRRRTQPPGASLGSIFKNPPGDYAGRLIEAAGLKGATVGDAQISEQHANFFINRGQAGAADIYKLIQLARRRVYETSGIELELEIEPLGEWHD